MTAPARTAPKPQNPQSRGWTPERRTRQAARIRLWAPWARSTGPRTAAGKAASAQNAAKPGRKNAPDAVMARALKDQSLYLLDIHRLISLKKTIGKAPVQNELLKRAAYNLDRRLKRRGPRVASALEHALLNVVLCKNLAFWPPLPLKVNANDG